MTIAELWAIIDKGGLVALSFLVVIAFVRGWVVPRWVYNDLMDRTGKALEVAEKSTQLAEKQADAVFSIIEEIREYRRMPTRKEGR